MKLLGILILFFITNIGFANDDYTIRISPEVVEAMDLSPELAARLSGGDIIGNGGGLVEQEFRFAYRRLPRVIRSCVDSFTCPFAGDELNTLMKIGEIASKYIDKKDRLIFLAESDYPGFFRDSEDSQIRIAKSAFIEGAPIFINLDLVYQKERVAIEYSSMMSILVHELGHQAGERSHSLLDDMGAKLKDYLTRDTHVTTMQVEEHTASVRVFNLEKSHQFAEVYFNYKGSIVPLTSKIRDGLSCEREGSIVVGYEVSNPHWERLRWERGVGVLGYNAWIKASCLELSTSAIWTEESDLKVQFNFYDGRYLNTVLEVVYN